MKSGKVHLKHRWWNSNDLNPKGNSELCFYQLQYSIYVDRCLKNMTPLFIKKYIYIENMPTTGSWHRLTVWTRNRLSSVSRNQTHTLPATNYWEQSVYKCKMAVSLIICTVPTGPNLTPKRTPKADPGFTLGLFRVPLGSALCPLLGVRFVHSCMKRTPLCFCRLLAPPLVYSKYTVQSVH